jgi:hypothetical protein
MADRGQTQLRLEIGHVLIFDIVGYSKLLIDQQTEDVAAADEIRSYYQSMSAEERAEDEQWGKGVEPDAKSAWE